MAPVCIKVSLHLVQLSVDMESGTKASVPRWTRGGMHCQVAAGTGPHPATLGHVLITINKCLGSQVWWHMRVIPELQKLRLEDLT